MMNDEWWMMDGGFNHPSSTINRQPSTVNRQPSTIKNMISMEYKNKRGKLSDLMSENQKISGNIQILSYDFACRISRLFQYLTEDAEYKEFVMAKQVYRSGTSIGANIREANHAQSKADFLNKMSIALKEADETDYWLNLLHDNGYLNDSNFESINRDSIRILKCLSAIVKSVKTKLGK